MRVNSIKKVQTKYHEKYMQIQWMILIFKRVCNWELLHEIPKFLWLCQYFPFQIQKLAAFPYEKRIILFFRKSCLVITSAISKKKFYNDNLFRAWLCVIIHIRNIIYLIYSLDKQIGEILTILRIDHIKLLINIIPLTQMMVIKRKKIDENNNQTTRDDWKWQVDIFFNIILSKSSPFWICIQFIVNKTDQLIHQS